MKFFLPSLKVHRLPLKYVGSGLMRVTRCVGINRKGGSNRHSASMTFRNAFAMKDMIDMSSSTNVPAPYVYQALYGLLKSYKESVGGIAGDIDILISDKASCLKLPLNTRKGADIAFLSGISLHQVYNLHKMHQLMSGDRLKDSSLQSIVQCTNQDMMLRGNCCNKVGIVTLKQLLLILHDAKVDARRSGYSGTAVTVVDLQRLLKYLDQLKMLVNTCRHPTRLVCARLPHFLGLLTVFVRDHDSEITQLDLHYGYAANVAGIWNNITKARVRGTLPRACWNQILLNLERYLNHFT